MTTQALPLQFTPLPILSSNYVWVITNPNLQEAYVVDPGESLAVIEYLAKHALHLKGLLITHSHHDHIGGIPSLIEAHPAPVYGPDCSAIPAVDHRLYEGSTMELWQGCHVDIMHLPGHLPEHIVYFLSGPTLKQPALFAGDVIFSSGCGRMFTGPAPIYKHSLDRVTQLPDNTEIYCAHEYTEDNLRFASGIEPDNMALVEKLTRTQERLTRIECSLPTTLGIEKQTNPFLRCHQPSVQRAAESALGRKPVDDVETFSVIRRLKDEF